MDEARRDEATQVMRQGAELTLTMLEEVSEIIRDRHLLAPGMEEIAADPVLSAASLRAIRATVKHWTESTAQDPWAAVSPADDPDSLRMARDLVRRGLSQSILTAYRVAQVDAWRSWIAVATQITDDPEVIRIVLDRTAESIGDYNERTLDAVRAVIEEEHTSLRRGDSPERREMIELLLDGAPVPVDRASMRLGLDLRRPHAAIIVWTVAEQSDQSAIEEIVDLIRRTTRTPGHVTMFPSTGIAWLWCAGRPVDARGLERELHTWPNLRVAIGESRVGTEGFRASHRSAAAVQRLMSRSGLRQVARAEDTRLAALLSRYGDEAADFARTVLGDLATATPDLLLTVRTYLEELGNVSRAAERLYAHRNTVVRRLEKADQLLPRPLAEQALDTGAALELWHWLGSSA